MRLFRIFLITILLVPVARQLFAQEKLAKADRIIENILEDTEMEHPDNDMVQNLYYFIEHPLPINSATEAELQRLYLLNSFQIQSLLDYISKRGDILSKYEMQLIYGFDRDVVEHISPFITFQTNKADKDRDFSIEKVFRYANNQILLRSQRLLETPEGYKDQASDPLNKPEYQGNPNRYYLQYKNRFSDYLRMGFTMEKDPGEPFFAKSNPNGFDYYSGYLSLRNTKVIDALVLGDYHVRFGQGLTVWSGFSFGKTPYVLDIMKNNTGFDEYSSTNENQFFRGVAVSKQINRAEISAFYSNKAIDANLVEEAGGKQVFTSFQTSGYHRKATEIKDENSIEERIVGGNVMYNFDRLKIGITGIHYAYDRERSPDSAAYNIFDVRGKSNANLGAHYQFQLYDFYFFGEEAVSPGHGYAFLNGVRGRLAKGLSASFLHRYYQPEYRALYGGAFGENASNQNEEGWYLGLKSEIAANLTASMFLDVYRFPWLRFTANAPSEGYEYLVDVNYSLEDKGDLSLRIKNGLKGTNFTSPQSYIQPVYGENKTTYRLHFNYQITDRVLLRNRVAFAHYSHETINEQGWMVYQDVRYTLKNIPFKLDFRYAVFDTDSYKTRIYAYEHDLLYAFSIPAYYSKGFRTYLTAHYNRRKFDVWFKVSRFLFADKKELGSGSQTVRGNTKTNVKVQVMFKW